MADPSLRASLGDLAGLDADSLAAELAERRRIDEDAIDPIADPLALPEDRPVVGLAELVARARKGGRVDLLGARGGALPLAAATLARGVGRPVVLVTADIERARTLVSDLEFLTHSPKAEDDVSAEDAEAAAIGDVLLLTAPEASPYAEVAPDRRAALSRLATLAHLASPPSPGATKLGRPFLACVLAANALVRRFVPRAVLESHTVTVIAEDELDREVLLARLTESGYLRVPVVEDPGSFAVRGSLVDVWPPSAPLPVRIELDGDLVMSMKAFDPDGQRTLHPIKELRVPPAREAILDEASVARAKARVSELCDAVDMPTSKARQLAEDVAQGRAFFGAEGFLPAYYEALDTVFAYLPDDATWVIDDPIAVAEAVRDELARAERGAEGRAGTPSFGPAVHYLDEASIAERLARASVVVAHRVAIQGESEGPLSALTQAPDDAPTLAARAHEDLTAAVKQARATRGKRAALEPLVRRLRVFREHGLRTVVTARTTTQAERLVGLLRGYDMPTHARLGAFDGALLRDEAFGRDVVEVVTGSLVHGAILPTERLAIVTEEEVFGARIKRRRARQEGSARDAAQPFLEDLRALSVGDLVVHAEHGVGKYLGLEHRDLVGPATFDADGKLHQSKTRVDLIVVEYSGGDRLYLPVYRLNQIQKYVGGEGESPKPKLDRLGGTTFAKTKARVEKAVRQMADELLRLYAERQALPGEPLPEPDDEYRGFEATFPFEETPDQQKAIEDVLRDLSQPRPMDRLVCGDVGFGKTEVAIRAAFLAATAGKQVAVLCPTTVLAQQHFHTFSQRLEEYPLNVAALSRFQTKGEQDAIIRKLKEGKIDVVIGTHRLLSKDVHFKDLGLLVVDEEQRFGVTHKERIKQLKTKVHVLTLTATPIPRTLQMAVSGLRDLSLITTPPVDRRAIRTIVTRWDDGVIREAIGRELQRGGQVFYVHNRVGGAEGGGIYDRAIKVQELVPRARVVVAHGQMAEKTLEQAMLDFVEGQFDVLCATSIVESGLDIPRANTIVIDRADMFGLSQLYQLRGRVGRSKERAYCYLVVPPTAAMSDEARARIEALEKHTELGAGFKIAALDLEIRGAGDLLGAEQSGNVAQVGFEMFCGMLEEAVRELRGDAAAYDGHDIDPELSFDVEAFLPDDYVADVGVRLSLYKRFAQARDEDDVNDLAAEMEDRFGPPPEPAACFVRLMRLKCELRSWRALGCEATRERVTLHLRADAPIDAGKVSKAVSKKSSPWKLSPDMRLTRRLAEGDANDGLAAAEKVLGEIVAFKRDDA
ncbi:MAG: transcription-repair coupling factor [Deltaproteobacteria bacterium]|nr:transcription-repair coupling factor [Deltaproteobacteria bacterium]